MINFRNKSIYFIAEAGVNHEGDLKKAKEMVLAASRAGADAIKFQTYKAEKIASKNALAYWDTNEEPLTNQYDLFRKFDGLNQEDYEELASFCRENQIDFASTPFDLEAVDFLDPLVSYFKIASADITNSLLIEKVAKKGKPIILSTGASTKAEIFEALSLIREFTSSDVCLMHCVLNYPTKNQNANLRMITDIAQTFSGNIVGYSDHTKANSNFDVLNSAFVLGAKVIEKHFTLDKNKSGNDHYHSLDEKELTLFQVILGSNEKNFLESEVAARENARRSLFYNQNFNKGDSIRGSDVIALRPGNGVSPMRLKEFVGKKLVRNVRQGEYLNETDFE
jgi:N-acetylneuraminate synthase